MSMLVLEKSVKFGDKGNDYVKIIIVFASFNSESYMDKLVKLVGILEQKSSKDK